MSERLVSASMGEVLASAQNLESLREHDVPSEIRQVPALISVVLCTGEEMSTRRRNKLASECSRRLGLIRPGADDSENDVQQLAIVIQSLDSADEAKEHSIKICRMLKPFHTPVGAVPQSGWGPGTPLRPDCAMLLCNLARVREGSLVLDPFSGQGSIPAMVKALKGVAIGADVNLGDRSAQSSGGFLLASVCSSPFRDRMFDAVVCDPPFGLREPRRHESGKAIHMGADQGNYDRSNDDENDCTNESVNEDLAVAKQRYLGLLPELLKLAARVLRDRSRLVFTYPVSPYVGKGDWTPGIELAIPERFKLVGFAEQDAWKKATGHTAARRIVILESKVTKN